MRIPRFGSDVIWMFVGNAAFAASQWAQLAVLTKTVSQREVGIFALAYAQAGPLMVASNFGLRTIQVTDRHGEFRLNDYFRVRCLSSVISAAAILVLLWLTGQSVHAWIIVTIVTVVKALDNLSDVAHAHLQREDRMRFVGISLAANGIATFLAVLLISLIAPSVLYSSAASAAVSLIILLALNLPAVENQSSIRHPFKLFKHLTGSNGEMLRSKNTFEPILTLLRLSIPLTVASALTALNPNIPRYALSFFDGNDELAKFAALAYLVMASQLLMGAVSQVLLQRFSTYLKFNQIAQFLKVLGLSLIFSIAAGFILVTLVVFIGDEAVAILYSSEYIPSDQVLVVLALAVSVSFVTWFVDSGLAAARIFTEQIPINIVMIALALTASLTLVPRMGLEGAAWALLLSVSAQCTLKALLLVRRMLQQLRGNCMVASQE